MLAIGTAHVCGPRDSFKPPLMLRMACLRAHPENRSCPPCPKLNFWSTYPLLAGSVPLVLQNELSLNPATSIPTTCPEALHSLCLLCPDTNPNRSRRLLPRPPNWSLYFYTFPFQVQSQNICPINTFLFCFVLF